ncbi:MAG: GntR family transcriptional regulator [Halieaceae bacterium]|nr:GntR family transcriptional regulator [Halieaceae bacterium]
MEWREDQPIYRQIAEVIASRIADSSLLEGTSIPSVRQLASDFRVNHLTVNKAYQSLIEEEVLCTKRGVGVFVCEGAQAKLQQSLKRTFFEVDLPYIYYKAQRLGINSRQLCDRFAQWEQE